MAQLAWVSLFWESHIGNEFYFDVYYLFIRINDESNFSRHKMEEITVIISNNEQYFEQNVPNIV